MLIGYTTNAAALQPLMQLLDAHLLKSSEVAAHLRYTDAHMSNLRRSNKGPPWYELASGGIRYDMQAVLAWQLAGERGALTLDRVATAVASCPALTIEQRGALIDYLETVFQPTERSP